MDRPVREKKPSNHYNPAKEAAKPQWGEVKKKKTKKPEDKKPEDKKPETKKPVYTRFISSDEEPEPEPPMAGSSAGAAAGPVHTYFSDSD